MSKKNLFILLGFVLLSIILVVSFFLFKKLLPKQTVNTFTPSPVRESEVFDSQLAVATGRITELNNDMITFRSHTGVIASFKVSSSVMIYPLLPSGFVAPTPTSDLQKIPLNQDLSLSLRVVDGAFEVENIAVMGPLEPSASSAQPIIATPPVFSPPKSAGPNK